MTYQKRGSLSEFPNLLQIIKSKQLKVNYVVYYLRSKIFQIDFFIGDVKSIHHREFRYDLPEWELYVSDGTIEIFKRNTRVFPKKQFEDDYEDEVRRYITGKIEAVEFDLTENTMCLTMTMEKETIIKVEVSDMGVCALLHRKFSDTITLYRYMITYEANSNNTKYIYEESRSANLREVQHLGRSILNRKIINVQRRYGRALYLTFAEKADLSSNIFYISERWVLCDVSGVVIYDSDSKSEEELLKNLIGDTIIDVSSAEYIISANLVSGKTIYIGQSGEASRLYTFKHR